MFPPSYSLATDIEQSRHTMQQQTGQNNITSRSPLPADNMVSHSTPQSSTIFPDNKLTASGRPIYHHRLNTMSSLQSRSRSGQTGFPGSSASANMGDRSFAPPSGTHIANSRNGNTTTHPFAAGPSSHVSMSLEATAYSSGVSNGSMAASAKSFSTYHSNDTMIDTPVQPKFLTAESVPFTRNGVISMVPKNAPSPQNTYTHPPSNMNQYTGYSSHNPPSLHSSQYRSTVTRDSLLPSGSSQVPHLPQYFAPPNSYPKSFTRDFGTQRGSQSADPPYQPAPSMAPSSSIQPHDPPRRNTHSHANSGRHRETRAQDTNPSSSTAIFCDWLDEDDALCPFHGSLEDLKKHFSTHLSGPQNALGRCHWRGCLNKNDIRRDSTWRHVRETHLKMKRGT